MTDEYDRTDNAKSTPPLRFQMKFEGWGRYDQLMHESAKPRIAFMVMQFGDPQLDAIVKSVFRPAVADAGFELRILTDVPKAGLIDDG